MSASTAVQTARTLALRVPAVYETVQAVRDLLLHRAGVAAGTFSQHGEDRTLERLLAEVGATGPYVDVGCNHPFRLSNTYLLYRSGRRGVCVDPLPRFERLYRRWRPDDRFRCCAVGETAGSLMLHQFEWDPLSTLDEHLAERYIERGNRRLRTLPVPVRTVDQILDDCAVRGPLSLLSIDVEGHELSVLRSIDLDRWHPAVVCLEVVAGDGSRQDDAEQHLLAAGFRPHGTVGSNVIYLRNDN